MNILPFPKEAFQYLGLCMRAGKVISGQDACVSLIRKGDAAIVLVDEEASENTKKRLNDACQHHDVILLQLEKDNLGYAIGKPDRKVVALAKDNMANKLIQLFKNSNKKINPLEVET